MKNSEWGAVSYLSQSKYGLNGTNIYINNVNLNNSTNSVYAVTGCSGDTEEADTVVTTITDLNNRTALNVYVWTEEKGTKASSTGTIYGIYDLAGGGLEKVAGFVANGNEALTKNGNLLLNNGVSTKYVTVYKSDEAGITNFETASANNYKANQKIGDAIRETSTISEEKISSWDSNASNFAAGNFPFFSRGGAYYYTNLAGLFEFSHDGGISSYTYSFRTVLVSK